MLHCGARGHILGLAISSRRNEWLLTSNLFSAFDRGLISRRQLLQALGIAVALKPAAAIAQGQCGGALKGTPECNTTPAKLPFEPTGWKTVMLDHFACQCVDYAKEAAYYQALMNWKIRSDDGKQAMLDIGDWGGLVLRGGYVRSATSPARPRLRRCHGCRRCRRAGPRRTGWRRAARAAQSPRSTAWRWGIDTWDAKKVEAELKARGLVPVAENHGDFQSFHVKDPDGFDLRITNGNRNNRRKGAASGKTSAPAPFESTDWKTVWLDHISFEVDELQRDGRVLSGAARLEARRR